MLRVLLCCVLFACATGGRPTKRYDSPPQSALANRPSAWQDIPTGATTTDEIMVLNATESTVRHRRILTSAPAAAADAVGSAIGGLFSGQQPPAPPTAQPLAAAKVDPEKLVIEAWIDMRVDDPARIAAEARRQVEADGGRVISENVIGPGNHASSAALELRVPPLQAAGFQAWLASRGVVESRRVLATDVGKQLFDQDLALKNLDVTMTRLQKLAEKDGSTKELIEVEAEMTRVRGQIERLKGEQRWLLDRVAFATITLTLTREGGPVEFAPHARIHPGVHVATLMLLDPEEDGVDRPARTGGGVTLHIKRWLTFDFDLFPGKGGDTRAAIGTVGSALYSAFLGGGRRQFLNPYLGYRIGMGYLSGEKSAVIGGELGLEIYKHKYVQIGIAVRALAFLRDERTDGALHGQLGFEVPF